MKKIIKKFPSPKRYCLIDEFLENENVREDMAFVPLSTNNLPLKTRYILKKEEHGHSSVYALFVFRPSKADVQSLYIISNISVHL